jgi:hypothetical protein
MYPEVPFPSRLLYSIYTGREAQCNTTNNSYAICRSDFTTLSPVPLQEQPAVVLLLEGLRSHKVLVIREYGGHEDLRGSGRWSVIPYVHG